MAVTQLSVFLENKPGMLADTMKLISAAGVNIRALSLADTKDFGILRVIVSDAAKAKAVLSQKLIVSETDVIAAEMNDEAGALAGILDVLADAAINVEYLYAFTGSKAESAYVVLRVDDVLHAEAVLAGENVPMLTEAELMEIF
ncbi:MAG: ACT domain-containing protein [Firmicutes bacterium]|nr:ACT domain-containing protein [Bacillota bacterium]